MEKTALPIHFEDRSGTEFERLVFAYVTQINTWSKIEWLGQTGGDGGRDIWGVVKGKSYCYQCANYQTLTLKKVAEDIDKLVKGKTLPNQFIVVCGGKVSPNLRKKISEYATEKNIKQIAVWSGTEFEEKLRKEYPELIKRFVEGEAFPDLPSKLIDFAKSFSVKDDNDIVELLTECFDRPAFTTRFARESSIPEFEKAVNGTIEVLNTGMHRLNDGTIIRHIPSRFRISDSDLKKKLGDLYKLVTKLKYSFTAFVKSKDIQPCGCGQVTCPVYMLSETACNVMDKLREDIFTKLKEIKPDFILQYS